MRGYVCQSLPDSKNVLTIKQSACQHASSSHLEDLHLDSYVHDIWNNKTIKSIILVPCNYIKWFNAAICTSHGPTRFSAQMVNMRAQLNQRKQAS